MRTLALALSTLLLAVPASAQDTHAGTASGNLTVDGKPIPLRYAYVVEVDNVEEAGLEISSPRKYRVIVLCDRALPRTSVAHRYAPFGERRSPAELFSPLTKTAADQARGILLKLDSGTGKLFGAHLLFPGVDSTFSFSGEEYPDRVTGLKQAGSTLSGTALLPAVKATRLEKGPKKYQYRVSFKAPVLTEPAVTEKWEGGAALTSPPVQAIREYLAAAQKGDVTALRRLTAKSHLPYLNKPEVLEFLKSADSAKLAEQVKRAFVRGDGATVMVVSTEPNYSQVSMYLVRQDGQWKLCWP